MGVWTLKRNYLDRVNDVYKAATGEVAAAADKLNKAKQEKIAVNGRRDLSADGKNIEAAKLAHEIFELNQQIEAIRAEAHNKARAIRAEAERDFFGFYNATPADVDEKTVAFINSGVATEKELLHMAKTANRTMKRIIGAKLAQSNDDKTAFWGRVYQQTSVNPHLEAIDSMMGVGKMAMGGGLAGPSGANGFLKRWDYVTKPVYDSAPNVGYTIMPGGERRYYEGEQCPFTDD